MAWLGCPSNTPSKTMLSRHHTNTRCNAGLLLIVFGKHWCSTCMSITQLLHYGNAAMAEWLKRLTRNQMRSSCIGSNPTRNGDSYSRLPDRKTQLPQGPTPPATKAGICGASLLRLGVSGSTPFSPTLPQGLLLFLR